MSGRLSVVATPIGCLEDITLRALRVLREADLILAEDTRHTRTLCIKHGIDTPLRSFHEHSSDEKTERVLGELVDGAHYALVSDAGTPLISDPGAYLVSRAAAAGVEVEAVPGPSAVLATLSVSGLSIERFAFEGFLPRSGKDRRRALDRLRDADCAVVIFESPHRIVATLEELEKAIGDTRRVALCRELTKIHEQTLRGTISEVRSRLPDPIRGEITLVVEAKRPTTQVEDVDVDRLVSEWQQAGLTTKQMAQRISQQFGWSRNSAYQAVLETLKRK